MQEKGDMGRATLGGVVAAGLVFAAEVAVGLLVLQAIAINRLAGVDYPLWARRVPTSAEPAPR
jgi:hypothetical protein